MNKVKLNEAIRNTFKKLYTLGQFLFLSDISPKSEILEEKIKELEEDLKEDLASVKDSFHEAYDDNEGVIYFLISRKMQASPQFKF